MPMRYVESLALAVIQVTDRIKTPPCLPLGNITAVAYRETTACRDGPSRHRDASFQRRPASEADLDRRPAPYFSRLHMNPAKSDEI